MSGPSNFTVTPDGCADLLLRRGDGGFALEIVGPMSRSQHVSLMGENNFLAIRFKPGCWVARWPFLQNRWLTLPYPAPKC